VLVFFGAALGAVVVFTVLFLPVAALLLATGGLATGFVAVPVVVFGGGVVAGVFAVALLSVAGAFGLAAEGGRRKGSM